MGHAARAAGTARLVRAGHVVRPGTATATHRCGSAPMTGDSRTDTTPLLSLVLGYGPAAILPMLALDYWARKQIWAAEAAQLWGAAILIFLAGVARGLSFFTNGGPRLSQIATMALRFWPGLIALVLPIRPAMLLLAIGYAGVAFSDVPLAHANGAPAYFARLRPPQMAVAVAGLLAFWFLLAPSG